MTRGADDPFVTTGLNALLTELYVKIDDWLGRPPRTGRPPKLSDAELLTMAVAWLLLGVGSDATRPTHHLVLPVLSLAHIWCCLQLVRSSPPRWSRQEGTRCESGTAPQR